MNRLVFPFILAALIFSCKEISYKEPQPRGKRALTTVPAALQGTYLLSDAQGTSKDTLIVTANSYRTVSDRKQNTLGDSLVLKAYKGYYFLNVNENPEWLLRVMKQLPNGDVAYYSMDVDEKKFNELIRNLSKEIDVDSVMIKGETLYQIDPSPGKLMKLIRKGYFKQTIVMKKMQ